MPTWEAHLTDFRTGDPFATQTFEPLDTSATARTEHDVSAQPFLVHLGVELTHYAPGQVSMELAMRPELKQNLGFAHGGVTATLLDAAAAYAVGSLAPKNYALLTVELKINLIAPGAGNRLVAHGRVIKPGRTLTVAESRVMSRQEDGTEKLAASAVGTFILRPRDAG